MLNPAPSAESQLRKSSLIVSNPEAISRPQIIGKTLQIAFSYSQFTLWTGLTGQCHNVAQYHPRPRPEGPGLWRSLPRPPCVPGLRSPQDQGRCPTRAHAHAYNYPRLDLASGTQDRNLCPNGPSLLPGPMWYGFHGPPYQGWPVKPVARGICLGHRQWGRTLGCRNV